MRRPQEEEGEEEEEEEEVVGVWGDRRAVLQSAEANKRTKVKRGGTTKEGGVERKRVHRAEGTVSSGGRGRGKESVQSQPVAVEGPKRRRGEGVAANCVVWQWKDGRVASCGF